MKYSHRFYAEFAREAMLDQAIFGGTDPISICWAPNNPFEKKEQEMHNNVINEVKNMKEQQKMMKANAKRALKVIDTKFGTKRKRKDDNFENNLMDGNKRSKNFEEDEEKPVDSKEIADNLSKLSGVFQRMEKENPLNS